MQLLLVALLGAPAPKEIIFKVVPGYKGRETSIAETVANISGLGKPKRIFRPAGRFEKRHSDFGLDRWYSAEVRALPDESLRALRAQASIVQQPSVRNTPKMYGEPITGAPNDPEYSSQPHYPAVDMEGAWAINTGDPSVVVAIVDSGIDMTHEDLRQNQWVNIGEVRVPWSAPLGWLD